MFQVRSKEIFLLIRITPSRMTPVGRISGGEVSFVPGTEGLTHILPTGQRTRH